MLESHSPQGSPAASAPAHQRALQAEEGTAVAPGLGASDRLENCLPGAELGNSEMRGPLLPMPSPGLQARGQELEGRPELPAWVTAG